MKIDEAWVTRQPRKYKWRTRLWRWVTRKKREIILVDAEVIENLPGGRVRLRVGMNEWVYAFKQDLV